MATVKAAIGTQSTLGSHTLIAIAIRECAKIVGLLCLLMQLFIMMTVLFHMLLIGKSLALIVTDVRRTGD